MSQMGQFLWGHVSDLVFDCVYVVNLASGKPKARMLQELKHSADRLGESARMALARGMGNDSGAKLQQLRQVLGMLHEQLIVANGLGAIRDDTFQKLERRTVALMRAFCKPKVMALFLWAG